MNASTHALAILSIVFILAMAGIAFSTPAVALSRGFSPATTIAAHAAAEEVPNCPTTFVDLGQNFGGLSTITSNDATAVCGSAITKCDDNYTLAKANQEQERAAAQAQCEAVAGCVFSYKVKEDKQCACNAATDCTPPPHINPNANYSCSAKGSYDLGDYKCTRPAPTPAPAAISVYRNFGNGFSAGLK